MLMAVSGEREACAGASKRAQLTEEQVHVRAFFVRELKKIFLPSESSKRSP